MNKLVNRLKQRSIIKYSTRLVIILNNVVIKIPVSRKGYLQGLHEKKIWDKYNNINSWEFNSLAELKWMCMGIVCQKRYDTVSSIPSRVVNRIKSLIHEFDFDNCDLHNHENWGIEGNRYILLDYGINNHIASLYNQSILDKIINKTSKGLFKC